ncbi:MAG: exo-alpha-sialidase, partial [Acidobacteria bacterium]|nr:exo-alpha-sialidase [Acidobacteriota bacterium]
YVCWANEREGRKGNIRFARSTDGGKTFSKALTLNSDAAAPPVGHAFQSMTVDRQGRIYVAWIDERRKTKADRGGEIWMSVSTNRGQSFGHDYRILSDVCECCRTTLAVDARGTLFLSYRTVPNSGPMMRDIIVARSVNAGKTFTPVPVSADGWEVNGCPVAGPSLNLDAMGNPVVVWFMGGEAKPGLYFSRSTDGGKTYASRQTLDATQHIGKHVHLAGGLGNPLFAAWDDADAKTFSVWGAFDGQTGVREKSANHTGIAYPVAAVNGNTVLIAGLNLAAREIQTFLVKMGTASSNGTDE